MASGPSWVVLGVSCPAPDPECRFLASRPLNQLGRRLPLTRNAIVSRGSPIRLLAAVGLRASAATLSASSRKTSNEAIAGAPKNAYVLALSRSCTYST